MWEREREREGERERERENKCSIAKCEIFSTYFVSCNGLCVPKEKWHRKEHIIIIIVTIIIIIITN